MNKEQALQYITNGMSLRAPQAKSLSLCAEYLDSTVGQEVLKRMKGENRGDVSSLESATKEYTEQIPELMQFQAFERTFPAYTFALATGVGKTRLMGAFVTYLYLVYGIQHFMIVAPGNTIYRKLVEDFSKANKPKYVFRGIEELSTSNVKVVTKDNYEQSRTASLFANKIEINIFNIQQFAQKDIEKEKGITKGSELFGVEDGRLLSYFDYLQEQKDLVILMDESHHYHADAAMKSLDRIDPLLGLEFTATPYLAQTSTKKNPELVLKKNIFYSYNLGDAIRDGYVKDPWIGTETDVNFKDFDLESIETDARKLQLAAYFHERAKTALKEYAYENSKEEIKPVMLVVAKDTKHASELRALIESDDFRGGVYKGKVIEVHTKTKGEEADETIEKLISLEDPGNIVEIVIHVNMLKEGWDVANIYTIAPIRSSAAQILTEQTIGRGLRLPYGERTGNKNVDKVMIVAHDNYAKIIEEAKHSTLIQPSNIESISEEESRINREVVEVPSVFVASIEAQIKASPILMREIEAQATKDIEDKIFEDTPPDVKELSIAHEVQEKIEQIARAEAQNQTLAVYSKEVGESIPYEAGTLFGGFSESAKVELSEIRRTCAELVEIRNISIPRLILTPAYKELTFEDFAIETSTLSRYSSETSILEQSLQQREEINLFGDSISGQRETEVSTVSSLGSGRSQSPENTIISSLLDYPLIDYDEQKELLIKLVRQVVNYYRTFVPDQDSLKMMVENNSRQMAGEIYEQMLTHKEYFGDGYEESQIRGPESALDQYNISREVGDQPVTLDSQVNTFSRNYIYTGFKKACHGTYKFDSSDEARFAYVLEMDLKVQAWLRPSPNQFKGLYWRDASGDSQRKYEPDFVVELEDEIVMAEVKPSGEIMDFDVQEKKKTAEKYCELVSKNVGVAGITKPWRYVIVSTEKITIQSTASGLLK